MRPTSIITLALLLGSCSQSTEVPASEPPENGKYSGMFYFAENGVTKSGAVTFAFEDTTYQCTPNSLYLPPSGGGSYKVKPGIITLTDLVLHTAEFDWSLILNGDFQYFRDGSKIVLTQGDVQRNRSRRIEIQKTQ